MTVLRQRVESFEQEQMVRKRVNHPYNSCYVIRLTNHPSD